MNPALVQIETTRVAVLEHRGPPEALMSSVTRFIARFVLMPVRRGPILREG